MPGNAGTWVLSLVGDDSACQGTEPHTTIPEAHTPRAAHLGPGLHNERSHCSETLTHHTERLDCARQTEESSCPATKTQINQK